MWQRLRSWEVDGVIIKPLLQFGFVEYLAVRHRPKATNTTPDELVVGIYQCKQDHREKSLVVVVEAACAEWAS